MNQDNVLANVSACSTESQDFNNSGKLFLEGLTLIPTAIGVTHLIWYPDPQPDPDPGVNCLEEDPRHRLDTSITAR